MHDIYSFASGLVTSHPALAALLVMVATFPSIDISIRSGFRLRIGKK